MVKQLTLTGEIIPMELIPQRTLHKLQGSGKKMVKIKEEMISGNYWSPEMLKEKQTGEIITEGEIVETKFGNRVQLDIKIGSKTKTITLNPTSTKKLSVALSKDTADWIGVSVHVKKITQNVQGDMKDVIYILPKE